jgi:hypothetical protein
MFFFKSYIEFKINFHFVAQKLYYQGHYTCHVSLNVKYLDVHKKVQYVLRTLRY